MSASKGTGPRLTQLRIAGMRVVDQLALDLKGLTVLIGENGTGKSTILEAVELLRLAASPVSFTQDVVPRHGGLPALLRRGAAVMQLGCRVDGEEVEEALDYDFELRAAGTAPIIAAEEVRSFYYPAFRQRPVHLEPLNLMLSNTFSKEPAVQLVRGALENAAVHVPFETRPVWQLQDLDIRESPRFPTTVEPTTKLSRYGTNLANAFQELRNRGEETWKTLIDLARLGISHDIRDFRITPSGRGKVELEVVFGSAPDSPMPVEYLSEGQLAYLAMMALCDLAEDASILVFDEPEVHLHPALLSRVVMRLEELAKSVPVVLATHSDQLLDCLSDPAASVVLCDLDPRGATRLRRPNKDALASWLEGYRGVGSVRSQASIEQLFDEPGDGGAS